MSQNYCINCGKIGHINKLCNEPIISYGIICFNIANISTFKIEQFLYNKFINVEDFNYQYLNYIQKINKYKDDIKFLLIQRKHSLSYIEFIRGKYDEKDYENVKKICSLMSINELNIIKKSDFQILWDSVWNKTARNKNFLKEMNCSKRKFNYIKTNNILDNITTNYLTPEWGFPKGRRNRYEKNIDCAIREFIEETNLYNFSLLDRINFLEEKFVGTNAVPYKHVYYIGTSNENKIAEISDIYEIGDIGWFTIDEIIKLLRPYNQTKINIINQLYFFLTIILEKIKEDTSKNKTILQLEYNP